MAHGELFRKAITESNSGNKFPIVSLVKENPKAAAVLSKLIIDRRTNIHDTDGSRHITPPNAQQFRQLAMTTAQSVSDAETVMQILPDTDLCAQILVSSILSPKDMMQTELNHSSADGKWKLNHDISSALLNIAQEYFENDYKIKPLLSRWLKDILFRTGSVGIAVIPENSIDEMINGRRKLSLEGLSVDIKTDGTMRSVGILGPSNNTVAHNSNMLVNSPGLTLENLEKYTGTKDIDGTVALNMKMIKEGTVIRTESVNPFVTVTDNFNILKIPEISQKIRGQQIRNMLGGAKQLSVESVEDHLKQKELNPNDYSDRKLTSLLYKTPRNNHQTVAVLKTQDKLMRRSVGKPLTIHLPSESIIPVHVPNRPDHQIGYFVMIDQEGNPISKSDGSDYYKEMGQRMEAGNNFSSSMLEKSKLVLGDTFTTNARGHIDYSLSVYSQMMEEELMQRVRNGILGNNAIIANNEEVYRIMLARSLMGQHTQLLFIPAEFMTYMALRYKPNGVGKSLLEDGKIINSMRTMLLVGNVMTALRNSIGRTHVSLKLDPETPDPMKALETAMSHVMHSNNNAFPIGVSNPVDVVDYLQKSAYEFSVSGHPMLPDMEVDFSEKNSNYAKPDTELEKTLRDRSIQMYGLTPEMVDAAAGADFATTVTNNTVLLSKRVMNIQDEFTPLLSKHMQQQMINSSDLFDDFTKVVTDNYNAIVDCIEGDEIDLGTGEIVTKDKLKADQHYKAIVIKEVVEEFISNFKTTLPAPTITKTDNQAVAYKAYADFLEEALNAWINDSMFPADEVGNVSSHVASVREQIKCYYLREYQINNGIMTELSQLTSKGADGEQKIDIVKIQSEHIKTIMESVSGLFEIMKKSKEKTDAALVKAGAGDVDTTTDDISNLGGSGEEDFSFGESTKLEPQEETLETTELPEEQQATPEETPTPEVPVEEATQTEETDKVTEDAAKTKEAEDKKAADEAKLAEEEAEAQKKKDEEAAKNKPTV